MPTIPSLGVRVFAPGAHLAGQGEELARLWITLFKHACAGRDKGSYPKQSRKATIDEVQRFMPAEGVDLVFLGEFP